MRHRICPTLHFRAPALLFMLVLLTACGHRHITVYPPPANDSNATHCSAFFNDNATGLSAAELAVLEDESRVRDEQTIELMLKRAELDMAAASNSEDTCRQMIEQGEARFIRLLEQQQDELASRGNFSPSSDLEIRAVQGKITDLWRADQSARTTLINLPASDAKDAGYWANRLATAHAIRTDSRSVDYLETLLDNYDWIDQLRFGHEVSAHAWILAQHADDHVDLQAKVLARMEPYLEHGSIRPANYAYLWDRVAVNSDRPQRYGTQPIWECNNGQLELAPIEDLARADDLRKALGMNTVADQLAEMSRNVCSAGNR
ncbi:MAG: DUF6624 domain-containing protein [Pseudomonadota bacterium]